MKRTFTEMGDAWLTTTVRPQLKALCAHKAIWQEVLDAIEAIEMNLVWFDGIDLNLSLSGGGSKLAAVVRPLRRLGFVADAKAEPGATSYSSRFRHPSGATVYVSFSSVVCRRIQVGTRTVTEPIYEVVCDEQAAA